MSLAPPCHTWDPRPCRQAADPQTVPWPRPPAAPCLWRLRWPPALCSGSRQIGAHLRPELLAKSGRSTKRSESLTSFHLIFYSFSVHVLFIFYSFSIHFISFSIRFLFVSYLSEGLGVARPGCAPRRRDAAPTKAAPLDGSQAWARQPRRAARRRPPPPPNLHGNIWMVRQSKVGRLEISSNLPLLRSPFLCLGSAGEAFESTDAFAKAFETHCRKPKLGLVTRSGRTSVQTACR